MTVVAGVLNFASAKNPGGGFLKGSLAQEESIAIASTLYACQTYPPVYKPFYGYHASHPTPLYSHRLIVSPNVVVFRDSKSLAFLPEPYSVSVITCAAVNAGDAAKKHVPASEVRTAMEHRIRHVLAAAAASSMEHLVLGAFGCGVFRNDPAHVAQTFRQLLRGEFSHSFASATFAIPDVAGENSRAFAPFFG